MRSRSVGNPGVVFFDEPTAGVDPAGRIAVRDVIAGLRSEGVCVILTSHELDEVQRLADRVVIVDHGRVVAAGRQGEIQGGSEELRFAAAPGLEVGGLAERLGVAVTEGPPGEYLVSAAPVACTRGGAHGLARRPRPAAGRSPGRPPTARGRLLAADGLGSAGSPDRCPAASSCTSARGTAGGGHGDEASRTSGADRGRDPDDARARRDLARHARDPVVLLVFFTVVPVLPTGTRHRVDFLAPGVLALAVMSTAMVSLGIATAFERSYGVLKRLGATPLGRPVLLSAKIASVVMVEVIQIVVLVAVALALGWRPHPAAGLAVIAVLLATIAFAGIGLTMAGALRAEVTLAVANGVYVILLLIGGVIFPLHELGGLATFARLLPTAALSDASAPDARRGTGAPLGSLGRARRLGGRGTVRGGLHLQVGMTRRLRGRASDQGAPVSGHAGRARGARASAVTDDHVDRHSREDHGYIGDRVREQAHGTFRGPVLTPQAKGIGHVESTGEPPLRPSRSTRSGPRRRRGATSRRGPASTR